MWIDSHCHLDAPEFDADRAEVIARAQNQGVRIVIPSVAPHTFVPTQLAAAQCQGAYALGIHPLFVRDLDADALTQLAQALDAAQNDPRLVAVGEIGIDHFVPELQDEAMREVQERIYASQLDLAQAKGLPVILHVRRSADTLLKHLRRMAASGRPIAGGIAHAFNGSDQQAQAFLDFGFKLGFGGAMTFDRALQIRRLAASLPADAIVLETDAPDIPPHWLYKSAQQRVAGERSRNEPDQLPRIAQTLADLRGWTLAQVRAQTVENTLQALPRLRQLFRP